MKRLQMRFITSFLFLIFCIGAFAIGTVFAASPPPKTDTVSAKSVALTIPVMSEIFNLSEPLVCEKHRIPDRNKIIPDHHSVNLKYLSDASVLQPEIVRLE